MRHYRTDWITKLPIAHRGLWGGGVPENSLAAFGAAAAAGYAIEFDVTLSADARLVVSHDPTTGRVAGADLRVSRSRAADLAALSLGGGQAMPLLEDVMRLVAGRVPLPGKHCWPPYRATTVRWRRNRSIRGLWLGYAATHRMYLGCRPPVACPKIGCHDGCEPCGVGCH